MEELKIVQKLKTKIICLIIPIGLAITISLTFAIVGVFRTGTYGSIDVSFVTKHEMIVSEEFDTWGQPPCSGSVTLQHTDSGATIVKSYSFDSSSLFVETLSERWELNLEQGEWTIDHQRTSGWGDLVIRALVTGNHGFDLGIVVLLWFIALIMGLIGYAILKESNY